MPNLETVLRGPTSGRVLNITAISSPTPSPSTCVRQAAATAANGARCNDWPTGWSDIKRRRLPHCRCRAGRNRGTRGTCPFSLAFYLSPFPSSRFLTLRRLSCTLAAGTGHRLSEPSRGGRLIDLMPVRPTTLNPLYCNYMLFRQAFRNWDS